MRHMNQDWRLEHLHTQPHLRGARFIPKRYQPYRAGWDHDHCVSCLAKLADPSMEGDRIVHKGYATTADYVMGTDYAWACMPCFDLFKDEMNWSAAGPDA